MLHCPWLQIEQTRIDLNIYNEFDIPEENEMPKNISTFSLNLEAPENIYTDFTEM